MILALAGGVGGAKLAQGLDRVLGADLTVAVNTGDDFEHLGFAISPDLDTVMYTVAGLNNTETGWGLAGETWQFMDMLERLGGETWFLLGDRDLAVHVERTRRLAAGESLSAVTAALCERLGVRCRIAPMTDDRVRTLVHTDEGDLAFQHYFVRRRCEPVLEWLAYEGVSSARPSPALAAALREAAGIVIGPSNPYLSIQPILEVPGVREAFADRRVPAVAVSPIVGGKALKGPAAKIMRELGTEPSALEVAKHYRGLVDGFVLDQVDAGLAADVEALGMRALVTDTVMRGPESAEALARCVLDMAHSLK